MSAAGFFTRRRWIAALACIFALALGLRLVCVAQYEARNPLAQRPVIDEASYERWALEIAGGEWLGKEIFFQEPLYPYWLGSVYALAGDERAGQRHAARVVQSALGAATALFVALLGARLFGRGAGVLAGAAFALHRPAVWMPSLLLKPNLFLPILALFALALVWTRGAKSGGQAFRRWMLVGVLGGLGALLRGNMLILAPLFVLWPLARARLERRRVLPELACSAAVLAGLLAVLLPVAARNHTVGGRFVLTTSGAGTNFYGGNNVDSPFGVATEFPWVRGVPEHEADDWRHEAERRLGRALDATQTSDYWRDETLRSMRRAPGMHARILWNKLRLTLGAYEVPDNHFLEWDARHVPLLAGPWLPGFALLGTLSIAGALAWLASSRRAGPPLEILVFAAAYLATIVLTVTSERVRLALVPLLMPFLWCALGPPWPRGKGLAVRLACLAAAAAIVLVPVLPESKLRADLDERDHNLAVLLLREEGGLPEAEKLVQTLRERYPRDPRVLLLSADIDYRRARGLLATAQSPEQQQDVAQRLQSVLERLRDVSARGKPRERFQADALAGSILQFLGQWERAADALRAALVFDPSDRDVRRRLAVVLAEAGMARASPAERTPLLAEATAILAALVAERPDPEVEALLARMRAQL